MDDDLILQQAQILENFIDIIHTALEAGITPANISHLVNEHLLNFSGFSLDGEAEMASHNHRARGA